MKFFKRAYIRVKRKLWETILLLSIITILGTVVVGAFSIQRAVNHTEANLRRNMPTVISFSHFTLPQFETWEERNIFIHDVVHKLGNLPYVAYFEYTFATGLHSRYLRNYKDPFSLELDKEFASISIRGFSNPHVIYLETGNLEIVAGRTFTEEEINIPNDDRSSVAIISRQFAEHNDLWLGDIFELSSIIYNNMFLEDSLETIEYTFEVIGIRDFIDQPLDPDLLDVGDVEFDLLRGITIIHGGSPDDIAALHDYAHNVSRVFVPNWIVDTINKEFDNDTRDIHWTDNASPRAFQPHWVLSDPDYLDDFKVAAAEILPESLELLDYSNRFDAISHATDMLLQITNRTLIGVVIASLILLNLLITLFLYDRRHELGIYLALGEKKIRVIFQVLIEMMIVSVIGITLALFIGRILSNQLSHLMLRHEITSHFETTYRRDRTGVMEFSFGFPELTPEEMLEAFDASLTSEIVILFYAVGFLIVAVSSVLPVVYLVKLNAKKVLTMQ